MKFLNSLTLVLIFPALSFAQDTDWISVGNDRGSMRYSELKQINRDNVTKLKKAWEFHTGHFGGPIECTPIVIEGVMYVTTNNLRLIALNAATGDEIWSFDPFEDRKRKYRLASGGVNRGCAFWSDGKPDGQRRILHGISEGMLFSIDARTGELDPDFGANGMKDLREDLKRDVSQMGYGPTSASAICGDNVIVGFSCGEGPGPSAPGDVRAFDVRTGKQVWRFHTVPRNGEFGNETWEGDAWKDRGGANAWGGFSVDEKRKMVFCGTGSAAFDFYGGDRKGDNLFANCTIALNAETGERIWHFQTLKHDVWDHDTPIYPNLVTVERDGKKVDAVAQVTKIGLLFLFDRETGKPLFEIRQEKAPMSDVPGEQTAATQPVPVKPPPYAKLEFTEADITNISPESHDFVAKKYAEIARTEKNAPPSLGGSIVMPGFHGGSNWAGACFDPGTCTLYTNANNVPNIITLKKSDANAKYPYGHMGYIQFRDQAGYPAIKPPWGTLNAIDLNSGEISWQVPLGEYKELTEKGVPQTGTENFAGTIVTAGGLVFVGGTKDEMFRAFDKTTGKVLWETKLPAGGYATPCTYMIDGKQYVAIAAGGAGKLRTKPGDSFVAFALGE